jgi:K+-sensing histidine kinase KdpD
VTASPSSGALTNSLGLRHQCSGLALHTVDDTDGFVARQLDACFGVFLAAHLRRAAKVLAGGHGLGTSIVEALARQLEAHVEVADNKTGTSISVFHRALATDAKAEPAAMAV